MDHVNKQLRIQFFIELLSVRGEGQVTVTNRSPHCSPDPLFFYDLQPAVSLSASAQPLPVSKSCSAEQGLLSRILESVMGQKQELLVHGRSVRSGLLSDGTFCIDMETSLEEKEKEEKFEDLRQGDTCSLVRINVASHFKL